MRSLAVVPGFRSSPVDWDPAALALIAGLGLLMARHAGYGRELAVTNTRSLHPLLRARSAAVCGCAMGILSRAPERQSGVEGPGGFGRRPGALR